METRDDHTIRTDLKPSNDLQNESYGLNLFDDSWKAQTKIEEEVNQKESSDLQKLPDQRCRQSNKVLVTNDLILQWERLNDFFNLIEDRENNLTDEDLLVVKRELKLFIHTIDDVLATDPDYLKKIFYMYFNLFNHVIVQNYFKNVEMADDLKVLYRLCISKILEIMTYTCRLSDLGLNDLERPTNCMELLSLMLNYVKRDFKSLDLTAYPSPTDPSITSFYILSFMLWYCDKTVLTRDLMEIGCSEIMMDILKIICKRPEIHTELQLNVIVALYNISRHDDGVKELNNLNTSELIKAYQSNNQDTKINIACYTILVLLSTPEEIKKDSKRMNDVLDKLLEQVYDASISSDHRANGELHLSELLIVFVKLFNDDHTLDYIMEESQVDLHTSTNTEFFINQLIYHYSEISDKNPLKQATCTALVNILWSLSFQEKYKQELKQTGPKFRELIVKLTRETNQNVSPNQYVPKYIEGIQKAATGLLFNIDELISSATEHVRDKSMVLGNNEKPIIMISYSHEDTEFCKQLYNEILKKGHDVWIDFKFLKIGDLWEQIAARMKRADVILCLMSEDYCKSKSCRWEATYALDKLQSTKSIIPIFLQKHPLPDWLEIRTMTLKYVRFHDLKQLENNKLLELIDMIEYSLPESIQQRDSSVHTSVLPPYHESVSLTMTEVSCKSTLLSSNNPPVRHNEPTTLTSTVTKLENPDISCVRSDQSPFPEKPIEQWNQNDISQWFQNNHILTELRDLCRFEDGHELLDYAEIFLGTKKLQYKLYSNEFFRHGGIASGQKPLLLHEFTKFSNALRKLQIMKKST